MTHHLPASAWNPDEPASEEQIDALANAVIANKQFANPPAKYTPAVYGLFSSGDKLTHTVALILDAARDDEEVRTAVVTAIAAAVAGPDKSSMTEKTLRAVIARVIELEEL